MSRTFTPGQIVYVMEYHSTRTGERTYRKRVIDGTYRKNNSSWTTNYVADPRGTYIGYREAPVDRKCAVCLGEGKYLPEGFAPTASFRKYCSQCQGTGIILDRGSLRYIHNRKDTVLTEDEYAPIAQEKLNRAAAQERMLAEQKTRIFGMCDSFIKEMGLINQEVDPELAFAKYLKKVNFSELMRSADGIIKDRLPFCEIEGCNNKQETAYYAPLCIHHHYAKQDAERLVATVADLSA